MKLLIIAVAIIIVAALFALTIYIAVDARNHINKAFEYQQMYRRTVNCSATNIINCTNTALTSIVASTQELVLGIVEFVVAAIFLIIAVSATIAFAKMLAELDTYGYLN
jgi:hypothetical protein